MKTLVQNGYLLVREGRIMKQDILIEGNRIVQIDSRIIEPTAKTINANGMFISPGLIDVHVHLREPGFPHKETIESGTRAAARGGFTQICAMPNTQPVPDTPEKWLHIKKCTEKNALVKVHPYASITLNQEGCTLVDFNQMAELGVFAFSDDGVGIQDASIMLMAMEKAKLVNKTIVAHCEDRTLVNGGVVHDGRISQIYNVKGIPSVSESTQIARDLLLAEATGCSYHICHISTKESVRIIRNAKKFGIKVTAEVTPHHLLLCEDDIYELDSNYKMNPPLREKADQEALIEGLLDGTIDFIATDHAPHTMEEKSNGINKAPFGIVGLETCFPLLYTHFVKRNIMTLNQLIGWLSKKPAEVFNLQGGEIKVGGAADLTIIDLKRERMINKDHFLSKGKNTPFHGQFCTGWPVLTIVDGQIIWKEDVMDNETIFNS